MKSSLTEKWIVCRVCLKQPKESMQTIFDKNANKDLTQMLLECGGVPIKKYDHYPDKICGKCLKYLRVAYKFRVTCQRSHKHLSRFIAPVDEQDQDQEDQVEDDPMPDLNVELQEEEAEEIALKLEPEDAMGIKQEFGENTEEEEVVELFIPMDEEDEEAFAEFDAIDRSVSSVSGEAEAEYLDDIGDDFSTSDEEFTTKTKIPAAKKAPKVKTPRLAKKALKSPKPTTSRLAAKAIKKEKPEKKVSKGKKVKETSYICDVCGNIYPSQGRLTEHIKLHKGIKPHECEICGHAFAQTQQLARHMNTHTGNRPFKCNYCPAAFADLSTRNKHHRIHTNERPYVCDVCGKSFTYTNTLKFHKMIHTGEKPHVCDVCGKGFQQAYKLRNHKMTHEKKGIKLEKIEVETMNYQEVNVATAQILEI